MHAVSTNDSAAMKALALEGTLNTVAGPAPDGGTRITRRPFAPGAPPAGPQPVRRERYWDPTVLLRGSIAVVWAPYEFWREARRRTAGSTCSIWRTGRCVADRSHHVHGRAGSVPGATTHEPFAGAARALSSRRPEYSGHVRTMLRAIVTMASLAPVACNDTPASPTPSSNQTAATVRIVFSDRPRADRICPPPPPLACPALGTRTSTRAGGASPAFRCSRCLQIGTDHVQRCAARHAVSFRINDQNSCDENSTVPSHGTCWPTTSGSSKPRRRSETERAGYALARSQTGPSAGSPGLQTQNPARCRSVPSPTAPEIDSTA